MHVASLTRKPYSHHPYKSKEKRVFLLFFLFLKGLTSPPWHPEASWLPTIGGEDVAEDGPELAVGGETIHHLLQAARCQPAEGAEPWQQPRAAQQRGQHPGDHFQDTHQHGPSGDTLQEGRMSLSICHEGGCGQPQGGLERCSKASFSP